MSLYGFIHVQNLHNPFLFCGFNKINFKQNNSNIFVINQCPGVVFSSSEDGVFVVHKLDNKESLKFERKQILRSFPPLHSPGEKMAIKDIIHTDAKTIESERIENKSNKEHKYVESKKVAVRKEINSLKVKLNEILNQHASLPKDFQLCYVKLDIDPEYTQMLMNQRSEKRLEVRNDNIKASEEIVKRTQKIKSYFCDVNYEDICVLGFNNTLKVRTIATKKNAKIMELTKPVTKADTNTKSEVTEEILKLEKTEKYNNADHPDKKEDGLELIYSQLHKRSTFDVRKVCQQFDASY